jgi:hypothetical protein
MKEGRHSGVKWELPSMRQMQEKIAFAAMIAWRAKTMS